MWRVGRSLGRTLYVNDVCVGMVDTPGLALAIVVAMNDAEPVTYHADSCSRVGGPAYVVVETGRCTECQRRVTEPRYTR